MLTLENATVCLFSDTYTLTRYVFNSVVPFCLLEILLLSNLLRKKLKP